MSSILNEVDIHVCKNLLQDLDDNISDELSQIMSRYGSDKGWGLSLKYISNANNLSPNAVCHNYTFFYNKLFQTYRKNQISIFEMGVGVPACMGSWAGSLLGWQEYFSCSEIFSADFDKKYLYNKNRIKSFYVDQENVNSIKNLWAKPLLSEKTFDLMIDDGPHTFSSNYLFFITSFYKLKSEGIYIIEDINLDFIDKLYDDILSYCTDNNISIDIEKLIIPWPRNYRHPNETIMKMNNLIFIKKK
jgi:hypothetical protein